MKINYTTKEEKLDFFKTLYEGARLAAGEIYDSLELYMRQYRGSREIDGSPEEATTVRNITYEIIESQISSDIPAPKVDSAVVKIDLYDTPKYSPKNEKLFRNLIKAAFEMRRKTLVNAISSKLPAIDKEHVKEAVISLGFPETVRGERLSTEDFVKLSDLLL